MNNDLDSIKFGKKSQMFFELSPYYFCTFEVGGSKWRTLIHYWVASYFKKSPEMMNVIRGLDTPERALSTGKRHGLIDFHEIDPKDILYSIQERFNQNDGLRTVLLSTGHVELVYDGIGFLAENNRYGRILMRVRDIYGSE